MERILQNTGSGSGLEAVQKDIIAVDETKHELACFLLKMAGMLSKI